MEYRKNPLPKIITFCGPPASGKRKLSTEIATCLNQNYSIIFENKLMISGETIEPKPKMAIEKDTFESQYHSILSYLISDMRNRSIAIQNHIDFVIYGYSVYDLLAYAIEKKTNSEFQKTYLSSLLLEHGKYFPSDMLIYCEPLDCAKKDSQKAEEIQRLKLDSILMQTLESQNLNFIIARKDDEIRAKSILSILELELGIKINSK